MFVHGRRDSTAHTCSGSALLWSCRATTAMAGTSNTYDHLLEYQGACIDRAHVDGGPLTLPPATKAAVWSKGACVQAGVC